MALILTPITIIEKKKHKKHLLWVATIENIEDPNADIAILTKNPNMRLLYNNGLVRIGSARTVVHNGQEYQINSEGFYFEELIIFKTSRQGTLF